MSYIARSGNGLIGAGHEQRFQKESKYLFIIGSSNGPVPCSVPRHQLNQWWLTLTADDKFYPDLNCIKKQRFSFNKIHLIMSSVKWHFVQGSISLTSFHYNANLMEISFYFNSNFSNHIVTIFCTCHDSTAVVSCAEFCCNCSVTIWKFHRMC